MFALSRPLYNGHFHLNATLTIFSFSYSGLSSADCFRCFHMRHRSRNVVQLFARDSNKCFVRERSAIESCPTETQIARKKGVEEMLLFRELHYA